MCTVTKEVNLIEKGLTSKGLVGIMLSNLFEANKEIRFGNNLHLRQTHQLVLFYHKVSVAQPLNLLSLTHWRMNQTKIRHSHLWSEVN